MTDRLIEKRILQAYQCDRYGNVRPLILMNELQGVADKHAEMLGCGRTYLLENNLAWVVTHYLVDILELPRESEELPCSSLYLRAPDGSCYITVDIDRHGASPSAAPGGALARLADLHIARMGPHV